MKITMTDIIKRQRARLYTQKAKTNCEMCLYTKSQELFKKLDNRYGTFIKFLNLALIYKKHDTFRYMTLLYTKI